MAMGLLKYQIRELRLFIFCEVKAKTVYDQLHHSVVSDIER